MKKSPCLSRSIVWIESPLIQKGQIFPSTSDSLLSTWFVSLISTSQVQSLNTSLRDEDVFVQRGEKPQTKHIFIISNVRDLNVFSAQKVMFHPLW